MSKTKMSVSRRGPDEEEDVPVTWDPSGSEDVLVSWDSTDSGEGAADKPQDGPSAQKIQVEFAMKVIGTYPVSYTPASSGKPPLRLDLEMFPNAVTGQVLLEGVATLAVGKAFGPHGMGALKPDNGKKLYHDDLLFRGFIGMRVQVIKTGEGLLVKKI